MTGSLRQRGPDAWELRIYLGVDSSSGRERWATKTVHGTRRFATATLAEFVEDDAPMCCQGSILRRWPWV